MDHWIKIVILDRKRRGRSPSPGDTKAGLLPLAQRKRVWYCPEHKLVSLRQQTLFDRTMKVQRPKHHAPIFREHPLTGMIGSPSTWPRAKSGAQRSGSCRSHWQDTGELGRWRKTQVDPTVAEMIGNCCTGNNRLFRRKTAVSVRWHPKVWWLSPDNLRFVRQNCIIVRLLEFDQRSGAFHGYGSGNHPSSHRSSVRFPARQPVQFSSGDGSALEMLHVTSYKSSGVLVSR